MRLWVAALIFVQAIAEPAAATERFAIQCASTAPGIPRSHRVYAIQDATVGEWYGGSSLFNLCRADDCEFRSSRQRVYLSSTNRLAGIPGAAPIRREVRFTLDKRTGALELVQAASAKSVRGKRVDLTRSRLRFTCRQVPLPVMAMN